MKKTLFIVLCGAVFVTISIFFSVPALVERYRLEQADRSYQICLEYREVAMLSEGSGIPIDELLAQFRGQGITAIAIHQNSDTLTPDYQTYDLQSQFKDHELRAVKHLDFELLVRPMNPWYVDALTFNQRFAGDIPDSAQFLLASGNEAYGYPSRLKQTADYITRQKIRPIWLEFDEQKGGRELGRWCLPLAVRGHSVDIKELSRGTPSSLWIARYTRAVRERGVRFLYLHLPPHYDLEDNKRFISALVQDLSIHHFVPGIPSVRGEADSFSVGLRQTIAAIGAIIIPLISFAAGFMILQQRSLSFRWLCAFGIVSIIAMTGALWVASVLSIPECMSGLYTARGIKAAYLAPVCVFTVVIMWPSLKTALTMPITGTHALIFLCACAAMAILVIRSGNTTIPLPFSGIEGGLRNVIEKIFIIRPRTKEIFIAYPSLLVSLWYMARIPMRSMSEYPFFIRCLLCIGMLAPVSTMNTFLHIHTPLSVSLIRSVHGIWVGGVLGGVLIIVRRYANRYLFEKVTQFRHLFR